MTDEARDEISSASRLILVEIGCFGLLALAIAVTLALTA